MAESGRRLAAPGSRPPSSLGGIKHLGEIPALDEVPGKVPGRWAVDCHPYVPPWHPGHSLPVNEICREDVPGESGKRSGTVPWEHLDWGGGGADQRGGGITLDPVHPILRPRPALCPGSQLSGTLKKGDPLPSKGRSSCTQSFVIRLL